MQNFTADFAADFQENPVISSSPVPQPDWVIKFDSIHDVLSAEKLFKDAGVWCDLIPSPRQVTSDCGMVLQFHPKDLDAVRELKSNPRFKPRAVYACSVGDFYRIIMV